jgi:hypothetical protein
MAKGKPRACRHCGKLILRVFSLTSRKTFNVNAEPSPEGTFALQSTAESTGLGAQWFRPGSRAGLHAFHPRCKSRARKIVEAFDSAVADLTPDAKPFVLTPKAFARFSEERPETKWVPPKRALERF